MSFRLFRMHVKVPIALLALIEGALFVFAPYLAAAMRFERGPLREITPLGTLLPTAVLFALLSLLAMFAVGLYTTRQRTNTTGLVVRIIAGISLGTVAITVVFYLLPALQMGRGMLAISGLIAIGSSLVVRLIFERVVDQDVFKSRVWVYGAGKRASSLLQLRRRSDQRGFRLLGFIATEGDSDDVPADRLVGRPEDLYAWARDNLVDEVVVAMDDRRRGFPVHEFLECRMAGIDVVDLPTFLERETGKVRLDVLNPSWIIFAEGFNVSPLQRAVERTFDIVASGLLILVALPFMLLAMLAIKLEDGFNAPVLYRQQRVGRNNEVFNVVKFRSMRVDAESGGQAIWATQNDPRVTRVGALMRKTRIDELPQLFTVLNGHMSFVGPRPERPEFVAQLEQRIPYYRERHSVKPGITGWAQLCYPYGATEQDALEKLQYDLYYVKNRSLLFDFAILVQTVEVVLWGKGAR